MRTAIAYKGAEPTKGQVIGSRTGSVVPFVGKRRQVSATRAKVLVATQFNRLLKDVRSGDHVERNIVLVMLSFYCGLRAQEIAGLRWKRNVFDSDGKVANFLHVTADIGKRIQERLIPINAELRDALRVLRRERPDDVYIIYPLTRPYSNAVYSRTHPPGKMKPNTLLQYIGRLYEASGFVGMTSHSGRRTFGTNLARRCNEANASLRDVQLLMGHKSLISIEPYIEPSDNQRALVGLVF